MSNLSVRHLPVLIVVGACVLSLALGAPARAEEPDSMSFGAPTAEPTPEPTPVDPTPTAEPEPTAAPEPTVAPEPEPTEAPVEPTPEPSETPAVPVEPAQPTDGPPAEPVEDTPTATSEPTPAEATPEPEASAEDVPPVTACIGFDVDYVAEAGAWQENFRLNLSGSVTPGSSCTIALPSHAEGGSLSWVDGTYPFPSGTGTMTVAGGTVTFTTAASSDGRVWGWLAGSVSRTREQRVEGTDVVFTLPGVGQVRFEYPECPDCHTQPVWSGKWANVSADGRILSEVRLGARDIAANPGVRTWTIRDEFVTAGQECVSAELRYYEAATRDDAHRIRSVSCDEAMGSGVTVTGAEAGRTYGLLVVARTTNRSEDPRDVGTIYGDGTVIRTVEATARWNEGGADGGETTPTPTPEPTPEQPTAPIVTVKAPVVVQRVTTVQQPASTPVARKIVQSG